MHATQWKKKKETVTKKVHYIANFVMLIFIILRFDFAFTNLRQVLPALLTASELLYITLSKCQKCFYVQLMQEIRKVQGLLAIHKRTVMNFQRPL